MRTSEVEPKPDLIATITLYLDALEVDTASTDSEYKRALERLQHPAVAEPVDVDVTVFVVHVAIGSRGADRVEDHAVVIVGQDRVHVMRLGSTNHLIGTGEHRQHLVGYMKVAAVGVPHNLIVEPLPQRSDLSLIA